MHTTAWLKAGDIILSFDELEKGIQLPTFTQGEKNAVQFCCSWLNGQSSFEFQTSGSTGAPKKISFRRDQLLTSALLTEQALHYAPGDTSLVCLDVKFIAGAMMLVRSLVTGLNIVVASPRADPLESINDKIDFAAFVPLQLTTLLKKQPARLNGLKNILVGGAPLDDHVLAQLHTLSPAVYATYGMTETITHIALRRLNGIHRQGFFETLPGISIRTDERGCLTIHADHLGTQPIVTNDLVTLIDPTHFQWVGRYDRVINSGGIKVQAEKVEKVIESIFIENEVPNRFFIAGIEDDLLGEKIVLIVEGRLTKDQEDRLRKEWVLHLTQYEIPRDIFGIPHFLETSTQKIDRIETVKLLNP